MEVAEAKGALLVQTLERLLALPAANLRVSLEQASDIIAAALDAEKVDIFLYDESRDSLVALGTSNQPLSALEKKHGLDVLAVANGGRSVQVFHGGETFVSGRLESDQEELRGIKEALQVRSTVGVPLHVGDQRRGVLMVASTRPEQFSENDARFAEAVAGWVGLIMHRAELVEEIARDAAEHGRRAVAEELVTVLAHDLRNYISPVELRLIALRKRAEREDREADRRDADLALRSVERLSAMVADILDVSRIDAGGLTLEAELVDLGPLLGEVARGMSTPDHAIELTVAAAAAVVGDARRIRQCAENLLSNAIKHSPNGTPVRMTLRREKAGTVARLDVTDQGPGIAPEILPRIFDRFVTGDARRGGTGLGLYLARQIAVAHGGELKVSSAPGAGTCLSLLLPCYGEHGRPPAAG